MCIRLDLELDIEGRVTDVNPNEDAYACVNFVVGKRNSSKIKIKT